MGKSIILIKLGGSAITFKDVPYKERRDIIVRLAREIKQALKNHSIVISHGSGSYAHTSAAKYGGKNGYENAVGIATVCADAGRINQIVTDIFVKEGLPAISLSPTSMILAENGEIADHFFQVVEELLKQGLIPIVYGDVIWDRKWKSTIFSGEKTLNLLADYLTRKGFEVEKVIQVGETDGVFDKNGRTIPLINKDNWLMVKRDIFPATRTDVTGGMVHKVEEALDLAKKGIETLIVNGLVSNSLINAVNGKSVKGTMIITK